MQNFDKVFGVALGQRSYPYTAQFVESTVPGNILWPGEQGRFTFPLQNHLDRPVNPSTAPYKAASLPSSMRAAPASSRILDSAWHLSGGVARISAHTGVE
jgi:hypothetical protein